MKIIITGATGFIGRNLAESFHIKGLEVIATGRSIEIGKKLQQNGIEFNAANITEKNQILNAFSPADCVIHCAAKAGDWGKYKDFHETNIMGTRHVIEACRKNDISKIIFISTPSIYFNGSDRYNILESERIPVRQFSYGKTKLVSESELLALAKHGFKTIILRPRAVYGKYDNIIVPRILQLSKKKKLPLINDGRALVDITYIDNFIDAVSSCLTAPDNVWNQIYNISNGDPITIKDWFAQVLEIFDRPFKPKNVTEPVAKTVAGMMELLSQLPFGKKKPALTRWAVGYMAKSMTLSIDKAREKLNYSPRISNKQGFEEFAKWYRSEFQIERPMLQIA